MKKEAILVKSKGQIMNDSEKRVSDKSLGFNSIVLIVMCFIFGFKKAMRGEPSFEFSTIIFSYLCVMNFSRFVKLKNKYYIFSSFCFLIVSIMTATSFFLIKY